MDWIAFDADDTLWKNEETYLAGRDVFSQILTKYDIVIDDLNAIDQMEIENIQYYGFGAMSFVLSLIEMAIQLTEGKILANDIQQLLDHGKWMLSAEVEVFDGVEALLTGLSEEFRLMMITKGDLFHQQRKIKSSGLGKYFQALEVVSEKSPRIYLDILDRYHISPENFVMVGNSLRSDILPVLDLGCWAIYLKQHLSWSYEDESIQVMDMGRYREVNDISQVIDTIKMILS
jgi:putative hydrolase of the HAD superfamily